MGEDVKVPRWSIRPRQEAAESVPGVLLNQHDVARTLRAAAASYEALDDLPGAMALYAAANGFDSGTAVAGTGFVLGVLQSTTNAFPPPGPPFGARDRTTL